MNYTNIIESDSASDVSVPSAYFERHIFYPGAGALFFTAGTLSFYWG